MCGVRFMSTREATHTGGTSMGSWCFRGTAHKSRSLGVDMNKADLTGQRGAFTGLAPSQETPETVDLDRKCNKFTRTSGCGVEANQMDGLLSISQPELDLISSQRKCSKASPVK